MAERPDEYELDDYPERKYGQDTDRPAIGSREEKFFQENSLRGENYKKFRIRQQMIESNRVSVHKSFLKGSQSEVKVLKRSILSDILEIPYDEVDETKFDLMVEPVDIETFKLYYDKNKPLLEYNSKDDRITILSRDNLSFFKTKYSTEISRRYAEREMGVDFSIKSDLSAIDLEVRQSQSEEYHRRIDNLEREVSYLKQFQDDSIEKDRKIEELESELERTRVNKDSQVENVEESLKLKSIQLVESQNEIARLKRNKEELEDKIRNNRLENLDELKKELDKNSEEYEEKLNEIGYQRDFYKNEVEKLEEKLKKAMDEEYKNIQESIKKANEAHDEKAKSISIQSSLKDRIISLESDLRKYESLYGSEKAINEDRELELNKAREKISRLEKEYIEEISKYTETRDINKAKIDTLKDTIRSNEKRIESQRSSMEEKKKYYEDIIETNRTEIGSLRHEKRALQDVAANLNREIQQSENTNDVLTAKLDRVNNEVIDLNGRIQELQVQNQTLTTELDALVSNFGNLVAASEATNRNNTLEIGRLKIKIKELEDNDDINERVSELLESVDNYKGLLDNAYEDKKKLKKEFEEEFDKLNKEKESLVQDLKNKSKNEEDLMKKLWQNENNYSLLTQKYEKTFSNIYDLTLALDKTSEREKF